MYPTRTDAAGRRRRLDMIVLRCRTLTAVRVVHYLARLEETYGRATPSRAGMAAAIGRCERSVSRAVGELERAGAVDVTRDRPHCRKDGTWGRFRTNWYRLKWPPKGAKAQVAPRGHALHVYALHEAIEPDGGARNAAPTPSSDPETRLFDLADPDPPPDPPDPPAPPRWRTLGISQDEWLRRCRNGETDI